MTVSICSFINELIRMIVSLFASLFGHTKNRQLAKKRQQQLTKLNLYNLYKQRQQLKRPSVLEQ